nr:hypothetical protein [Tanacetum cinerariifolium]
EPPDDNFDLEPEVISAVMEDIDEPDELFNPGGEIFVSTNNEDVDYFPFMFVIQIFLPYLILPEISPLFLSTESDEMIFYPENIKGEWRYLCPVEPQLITTCSYPTNQDFRYSDVFEYKVQPILFTFLLDFRFTSPPISCVFVEITYPSEIECDIPTKDVCSPVFTTFSIFLFKDNDDLDSSDDESLPNEDVPAEEFKIYSNPLFDEDEINSDKLDPHCFNVESDFVESLLNRDTFIDFFSKFDFSGEFAHIKPEIPKSDFDFEEEIRLIENLLYDNSLPRPPKELNAEIADTIIESIPLLPILVHDGNSQQEEIDIVTKTDDVLPSSDDKDDDYDPLLGKADLFLSDDSIPPGIENLADDPEGDIRFLEELLIDDFILSHELSDSNFEDNPSNSRPPPEPPDDNFDLKPEVISVVMEDIDEPDELFNPGGEIFVSTNNEDVDYFPFMFVIQIFLPYLILPEISPLFLSTESDEMIFYPGIFE